jgi:hypothetical protein
VITISQYVIYKFAQNSTTITNSGSGGDAYNGTAVRAQYAKDSVGYPIWGPLDANTDRIAVPGGISNPYQHTWQIGLNINQWWPVAGIVNGILCGNDGKLWAFANDLYYGYLHGVGTGSPGIQSTYNFTVESQGSPSSLDVQFWLGVEDAKPVQISGGLGTDDPGALYMYFDYDLQLHTNYYFQISVNCEGGPAGNDYYIGNCAPGCADAMVTGFPCGCYFYVWREDNTVLDLSGGGNWSEDVVLWKGGGPGPGPTPGPTPTPGTAPNVNMNVSVREFQPGTE